MKLTAEELRKHNAKALEIAKIRCKVNDMAGISVSYPDGDMERVQIALPCGVIRDKKRKVNAMQVRTGSYTISLAKEKTKFDDLLGDEYNDDTDYMPFVSDKIIPNEEIEKIEKTEKPVAEKEENKLSKYPHIKNSSKGILDL
jgi:hypothetical protein